MIKRSFTRVSLSLIFILFIGLYSHAQSVLNIDTIQVRETFDNIHIKKLFSDINASNFLIFIKKEVKMHKHMTHSETIFVLEGTGVMQLGNEKINVKQGDLIFVPENTPHAVKVTSKLPLKVISNQAPEFDGKDRVYVD